MGFAVNLALLKAPSLTSIMTARGSPNVKFCFTAVRVQFGAAAFKLVACHRRHRSRHALGGHKVASLSAGPAGLCAGVALFARAYARKRPIQSARLEARFELRLGCARI